jgi:CelD/BcsL family acetyltransferase involved in cellulose biosynthesis
LHCKIDWTGSVEAYLASLGPDSRRNFKRYDKKLFASVELRAEVKRFQDPNEIDRFLDDGIKVSDKTYQKNLLGLGLTRGGPTERRIRFAAERRSFIGHILYLNDEPVAFHLGYLFEESFFAVQMGYDPAHSSHQPGAVLFLHVLHDLERLRLPVRVIDCLAGVTDFKLRTTNRKEPIQNYYLFQRTMRGFAMYASLRIADLTVGLARALADRRSALRRGGRARR